MNKVVSTEILIKDKQNKGLLSKSVVSIASNVLLFLFLISSIIIPSDNFQTKKISFILLILINIFIFINIKNTPQNRYLLFYGIIYVVSIILISIFIRNGEVVSVVLRGYSGFMLLLYFIVIKHNINYEKMLLICLSIMAFIIMVSVILDFTKILSIFDNSLLMWLYNSGNAMLGRGANSSFYYLIFLKCSPLMLILLLYSLNKRKLLLAIITLLALIFSGTRANALVTVGVFVLYFFLCEKNKFVKYLAILSILFVIIAYGNEIYDFLVKIFQKKASSDAVRSGHMESILDLFKSNPMALLWGTGLDSLIYSKGADAFVTTLEISYWDLLRQLGLIGFLPFMFFLFYPLLRLWDTNYRWLSIAYFGFLLISYTNPFLYGSTGYCIYIYVYLITFNKAKRILPTIPDKQRLT